MSNLNSNTSGAPLPLSRKDLPELLCPAGSMEALEAAVACGADAVYLGASEFNARINAHNFSFEELGEAVSLAHSRGARVYLTLNTLMYDREALSLLDTAYRAAREGVDALIVADIGAAEMIHKALPKLPLHASTQMSGHCSDVGEMLAGRGFTRFVIAREATLSDIEHAVKHSGLEVEAFVHGALCVSHSGQCLFSSVVGGRSGNRGECAQPCRLPYCACGAKKGGVNDYPLSLKDLSLAAHLPKLISAGVSSLKIEGRMKSADYVGKVTSVWRRLLDERRGATEEEMRELSDVFSRGGFTDGYFKEKLGRGMMGIRGEEDKKRTAEASRVFFPKTGYLPLSMKIEIGREKPCILKVSSPIWRNDPSGAVIDAVVEAQAPDIAQNSPTSEEAVRKNLSKTGGTAYCALDITVRMDGGLMMPLSQINAMRREAIDICDRKRGEYVAREIELRSQRNGDEVDAPEGRRVRSVTARFYSPEGLTNAAWKYFSILYLPLDKYVEAIDKKSIYIKDISRLGVIMPPVVFDREVREVEEMLVRAMGTGVGHILVGNIGHIPMIRRAALAAGADMPVLHGDWRLNVTNTASVSVLEKMGIYDVMLSPELTLPRMRDIKGRVCGIVYGRLTLMTLEKCAIKELYGASACDVCATGCALMKDRRGIVFPVLREWKHRNIIVNSLPLSMTDREEELEKANLTSRHFIFTTETPDEVDAVIKAAKGKSPVGGEVRRISR